MKSETILIIESDLNVARDIVTLCFAMGHEPLVTRDGFTGLLLAKRVHPRLILSDVSVPGLDGFEMVRRVRQIAGLNDTTVVALCNTKPGKASANQNNFDDYLLKPIDKTELGRIIEKSCTPQTIRHQA